MVSASVTAALLASFAAPVAHAQIKPNLFFNYTFTPFDCVMEYLPRMWKNPDSSYKPLVGSGVEWTMSYTESPPDAAPGSQGQGKAQAVATIPKGSRDSLSFSIYVPTNDLWVSGTANASFSAPFGGSNFGDPQAYYKADLSQLFYQFKSGGDYVANYTFDDYGNHTFTMFIANGGQENDTVLAVWETIATVGIETAATSFDAVPKRTEPMVRDGALNPFYNFETIGNKGNWTILSDPKDVAEGVNWPSCTFKVPHNTSLVTIDAFTGPNASASVTASTWPSTPYERNVLSQGPDRSYSTNTLWSNFTGPALVHFAVLDPKVEYTIQVSAVNGRVALQSATFYSSFADKAPEGGGPAPVPPEVPASLGDGDGGGGGAVSTQPPPRASASITNAPSNGGAGSGASLAASAPAAAALFTVVGVVAVLAAVA